MVGALRKTLTPEILPLPTSRSINLARPSLHKINKYDESGFPSRIPLDEENEVLLQPLRSKVNLTEDIL